MVDGEEGAASASACGAEPFIFFFLHTRLLRPLHLCDRHNLLLARAFVRPAAIKARALSDGTGGNLTRRVGSNEQCQLFVAVSDGRARAGLAEAAGVSSELLPVPSDGKRSSGCANDTPLFSLTPNLPPSPNNLINSPPSTRSTRPPCRTRWPSSRRRCSASTIGWRQRRQRARQDDRRRRRRPRAPLMPRPQPPQPRPPHPTTTKANIPPPAPKSTRCPGTSSTPTPIRGSWPFSAWASSATTNASATPRSPSSASAASAPSLPRC